MLVAAVCVGAVASACAFEGAEALPFLRSHDAFRASRLLHEFLRCGCTSGLRLGSSSSRRFARIRAVSAEPSPKSMRCTTKEFARDKSSGSGPGENVGGGVAVVLSMPFVDRLLLRSKERLLRDTELTRPIIRPDIAAADAAEAAALAQQFVCLSSHPS